MISTHAFTLSRTVISPKGVLSLCRFLATEANGDRNNFGEKFLRKEEISFEFRGNKFNVPSVIQDTNPNGSPIGTVIAMHGSPGSHNDFKYVAPLLHQKGIRFIGVNFPGYGLTEVDPRMIQDNMERVNYVQALCDQLNLSKNLIFMGHSRGTENALKMAALNPDKTVGIVQANYLGARVHRGIRPRWLLTVIAYLWELGWPTILLRPLLYYLYIYVVNIKVKTGDEASWALRAMRAEKLELPTQKKFVEMLNKTDIKSVLLYSGKDPLMEPEIPKEMAALFKGNRHFELDSETPDDDIKRLVCGQLEAGTQSVALFFKTDGHFMQKHRAQLMADACETILKISRQ
uniref:AB hydrolase-1 domain-containing protein n=1 Tax=Steinernema glaseri TaxID=37863 RepID=A0A1I7ZN94_9BILA